MTTSPDESRPPKLLENFLLMLAGVACLCVLQYQLPRWVEGLDPTFVHPRRLEQSPFPLFFKLAEIHPVLWMGLAAACFARICWNYGWKLRK